MSHHDSTELSSIDNQSTNEHFETVLLKRRRFLQLAGIAGASTFIGGGLIGCLSDDEGSAIDPSKPTTNDPTPQPITSLNFNAVSKSLADQVIVPAGYTATVVHALGDPLTASTPAFKNDGTDEQFETRVGDHHDGMEFFGLTEDGKASTTASNRGILAINHEATTDEKLSSMFLFANGGTTSLPRPAAEVDKELAIHGISLIELKKTNNTWSYVANSPFNHRIHQNTPIDIEGPVKGSAQLITAYSPDGTKTRGTLNNCGAGRTPWNTYLTAEENWFGYFTRAKGDNDKRSSAGIAKSVVALNRYGRTEGAASRHGWETAGTSDRYTRWNNGVVGASAKDDFRNEMNGFGYIVEIDPYTKIAKKRTALGRFAHENAAFGIPVAGQPLAIYMGDDSRNEYIYKFVTQQAWDANDAKANDKMAIGSKYLNSGTLMVAKFNSDGTGVWLPLTMDNPKIKNYQTYTFDDQVDILINTRLAADAAGATKMDRPEWCAVNPQTGELYVTLTNNSNRRVNPTSSSQTAVDAANPRDYSDTKGSSKLQGNVNGHIIRIKDSSNASTTFTWDIYLFGAQSDADKNLVNISGLTADQDFSSPDGCSFSPSTKLMWIQTDDGAYTDVTNCMLLAAIPGRLGDGGKKTLNYTTADGKSVTVETWVGQAPTASTLKRFLVAPKGAEVTGITETPDGKTLFVNIQHPGENTLMANIGSPDLYESQWPSNSGYGSGKRPRSATIAITKNDGGLIGS